MSVRVIIVLFAILVALEWNVSSAFSPSEHAESPSQKRRDDPSVHMFDGSTRHYRRNTPTRSRTAKRTPTVNGTCRPDQGTMAVGRNEFDSYSFSSTLPKLVTCSNRNSSQVGTFAFEAPADATYQFTTYIPKIPTGDSEWYANWQFFGKLDILDKPTSSIIVIKNAYTCQVLACGGLNGGVVIVTLKRGDRVSVVFGGLPLVRGNGQYTLSIAEYRWSACSAPQVGATPLVVGTNNVLPAIPNPPYDPRFKVCGDINVVNPYANYFVAPSNGSYIFDTNVNAPVAITVRTELNGKCSILGCNWNSVGAAQVVVPLTAGQRATVIVGGALQFDLPSGNIPVTISKAVKGCEVNSDCPTAPAGSSPKFGYTCVTGGCVPRQCLVDYDCPISSRGVCDTYRCRSETDHVPAAYFFKGQSLLSCRWCFRTLIGGVSECQDQGFCCSECYPDKDCGCDARRLF